jgi:hypothetical protein
MKTKGGRPGRRKKRTNAQRDRLRRKQNKREGFRKGSDALRGRHAQRPKGQRSNR